MRNKFLVPAFLLLFISTGFAQSIPQQVINVSGNSFQQGHFIVDWSVGELAIINEMESQDKYYWLTNGFLQPTTNLLTLINPDIEFLKDEIRILPNPTRDKLEINLLTNQSGRAVLQLYNDIGQLIVKRAFNLYGLGQIQRIDMTSCKAGSYMLRIQLQPFNNKNIIKRGVYKIIKI